MYSTINVTMTVIQEKEIRKASSSAVTSHYVLPSLEVILHMLMLDPISIVFALYPATLELGFPLIRISHFKIGVGRT